VGSLGSGNRYRFDKKTTTDKYQAMDIRYLQRNGLLSPGRRFSLSWSRAGRQTGSIRAVPLLSIIWPVLSARARSQQARISGT
jgi:hypothetical protein